MQHKASRSLLGLQESCNEGRSFHPRAISAISALSLRRPSQQVWLDLHTGRSHMRCLGSWDIYQGSDRTVTVYCGDGFSYRGTVKTLSGASDSPDITFSLVSEPDMRPRLRFPRFVGLSGPPKNSPKKFCRTSERCVSPYVFPIFVILGVTDRSNRDRGP